jgi:hypothetical protein
MLGNQNPLTGTAPRGDVDITFDAPPVVSEFMQAKDFTRFILGPVGSGKTTGVLMEVMRRCAEQTPGPDGIRRTRWAIVRNTLSQLKQTVLRDIETWLGQIAHYRVSDNMVVVQVGDIYSEWFLIPLSEPEDQKRLLSMQLTGIWINEFIELIPDLVPAMAGRVGRFPSKAMGGPTWFGIVGDSNMPNVGSEWHRLLDVETPKDWSVFIQPGGMEPDAENIQNLPGGREYYERLERQHSKAWVKRYVHAKFGDDPDGTAVFRETFAWKTHVAPGKRIREILDREGNPVGWECQGGLTPIPGKMIIVGQDFGRNPCSAICQLDHTGRFLVLDEVVSTDMGLELHLKTRLRPKLMDARYAGMNIIVVGDPSGAYKGQLTEDTCFDLLEREGFIGQPASTNEIDKRLRAVDSLLLQNVAGRPGFLIDEARCPTLIRALNGLYRYGKTKTGQIKPLPEKTNPWSDLADALQYAALTVNPQFQRILGKQLARKMGGGLVAGGNGQRQKRVTSAAWT